MTSIRLGGDMGFLDYFKCNVEKMKERNDVKWLIRTLRNSDFEIRSSACQALIELNAIKPLVATLKSSNYSQRSEAAYALEKIGGPNVIEALMVVLRDSNEEASNWARVILGHLGGSAVEPLIAALGDPVARIRCQAAQALGTIRDSRAADHLVLTLEDPDFAVRSCAAVALGELGDPRAIEPLIIAMMDADVERMREHAACMLGELADARAVRPLLVAYLKDSSKRVRNSAFQALDKFKMAPQPPASHHDLGTRVNAVITNKIRPYLQSLGKDIVLVKFDEFETRIATICILGESDSMERISLRTVITTAIQKDAPLVKSVEYI
ncbi:MAG TPA: hypothetical protein DCE18_06275 [Syntrophobacteraceae bacterium]|nr:hypothetical protein [Syntrophobacteraceae bacterium]